MNLEDIASLQTKINEILISKASPEIIIAPRPKVSLHEVASKLRFGRCTLLMLYNEYRGRKTQSGSVTLAHVAAAMSNSESELNEVVSMIKNDPSLRVLILGDPDSKIRPFFGDPIILEGEPHRTVHKYVKTVKNTLGSSTEVLRDIYENLRGTLSLSGRVLTYDAIIGGIAYSFSDIDIPSRFNIISKISYRDTPLTMERFTEILGWYEDQAQREVINSSFYRESLEALNKIPTNPNLVTYDPQVRLERLVVRSNKLLDMIDMISDAQTSLDVPLIVANTGSKTVIKAFSRVKKDPSWFMKTEANTMRVVVRVSRTPLKYHIVEYYGSENFFVITRTDKYLPVEDIVHLLCSHLKLSTVSLPYVSNTTFSFLTNYISNVYDQFGIDRHIISWLVMNPPAKYASTGIQNYVFIREDTKPNALKERANIHIQFGTEKMFLTLSQNKATSGTLVPIKGGTDLIGFEKNQKYLEVKINKCPNIHYARLAQAIYKHVITMYLEHYSITRARIYSISGISLDPNIPRPQPLQERVPTLTEKYGNTDRLLYMYVPSSRVDPSLLPVPIERDMVQEYQSKLHTVIRLPTVVVNNPTITFETNGEIWLRTPAPGQEFRLLKKDKGGYIPIVAKGKVSEMLNVRVNPDYTLTEIVSESGQSYVLDIDKPLADAAGRFARLSGAVRDLLAPVIPNSVNLLRNGISRNIIHALNMTIGGNINANVVAKYAYLCMQECWDQTLSEIEDDIRSMKIYPLKHFRALEMAYKVNMYFIMDDTTEPYMRRPPHAHFYLHRIGNPNWPCIILHSLDKDPSVFTMITLPAIDPKNRGRTVYVYKFSGAAEYLDSLVFKMNVVRLTSPADDVDQILHIPPIRYSIGDWVATEQVLDNFGKCRAITYTKDSAQATINIGFAPVQQLPIGDIRYPTRVEGEPLIVRDLREIVDLTGLVMYPMPSSKFLEWVHSERSARVLRVVAHLLYSQSLESADEFSEHIEIDESISYDLGKIRNSLPPIDGPNGAWKYLSRVLPGMVSEDKVIYVPSLDTKSAITLYLSAAKKIKWPSKFPNFLTYWWDLTTHRDESIYLNEGSLLQQMVVESVPTEVTEITVTTMPFILNRGGNKYLIQMGKNLDHVGFIAYQWEEKFTNAGYESAYIEGYSDYVQYTPPDFTGTLPGPSYTVYDGAHFAILTI